MRETIAKCMMCIREGDGAEKEVTHFPTLGVCICEHHMIEMVKKYVGVEEMEYIKKRKGQE